jgi:sarcosine oxidase
VGPELGRLFKVYRQVLCWFDPGDAAAMFRAMPIFIWELQRTRQGIYGFPAIDGSGVKIATEQYAATFDPDDASREVSPGECARFHAAFVAPNFPALAPRCTKAVACLYTVTPDFQFVIDRHPQMPGVIVASPCSGHGFKHSAAIGEALADLAAGQAPRVDLAPFAFSRFQGP